MTDPEPHHLLRRQIFGADRSMLYVSDLTEQGDSIPHDHDFLEIVLIASGSGDHVCAHGVQAVSRGDFFVLRPGAWHFYRNCRDLHIYNCCCAPELLRRQLALLGDDPAVTRLLWTEPLAPGARGILHRTLTPAQTHEILGHLHVLSRSPGEPFTVRAGRLLVLLGRLGQEIFSDEAPGFGGVHVAVRQGLQLLEEAYHEEWTLTRMAGLTRLNPSYLTRLFKAATGRSPMAYLARHRAERAAKLLLATDDPVNEIGERVGWHDPNYFSRRFKSVFGVTPTAYRAQQISVDVPQESPRLKQEGFHQDDPQRGGRPCC
jgi:AraC family L-rhamnose operon transcriptional activator RhaR